MQLPTISKETRIAAVSALIESGKEPSPDNLLAASKRKSHPLHAFFWETPESLWADIGRYEGARRVLQFAKQDLIFGGKTIETRMVEYVRDEEGAGRWASMREIVASKQLLSGYMREIENLQEAATEKMRKLRDLISASEDNSQ
jgi:hypothetical protein